VGRVRHAETNPTPKAPLVFFRGTYASLTGHPALFSGSCCPAFGLASAFG